MALLKSALLSTIVLLSYTSVWALDGKAQLRFTSLSSEYEVTANENLLKGFSFNIGMGSGNVDLKKENGEWIGRFGMNTVGTTTIQEGGDGHASFYINVLPSGTYQVNINRIKQTMNISMPSLIRGWVDVKGDEFSSSNEFVTMNLRVNKSGVYTGKTNFMQSNGMYYPVETELYTSGDLNPIKLFDEDPALFAILYFLPISYVR